MRHISRQHPVCDLLNALRDSVQNGQIQLKLIDSADNVLISPRFDRWLALLQALWDKWRCI